MGTGHVDTWTSELLDRIGPVGRFGENSSGLHQKLQQSVANNFSDEQIRI